MPNILWTLLVATVTALVTTVATGVLVIPRLEARKRRIQEAHTARDTFNSNLLKIISACARLQSLPLPAADDPDCTEVVRVRLAAERERWMQQLDDATRWLIDHVETYAAGWPLGELRTMAAHYAAASRMVMISERPEETKAELLAELAAPVQGIYFTYAWNRARNYRTDRASLAAALARVHALPATEPTA
ncbi:hypothetical protein ACPCC5_27290 [Streptomyces pseudogriseolus]|uniref:Uri superfamily endonuclease n=1 Tax=Streptomyces albogriseolus TaxID=1887 RepID=A0ACC6UPU3_STRAO